MSDHPGAQMRNLRLREDWALGILTVRMSVNVWSDFRTKSKCTLILSMQPKSVLRLWKMPSCYELGLLLKPEEGTAVQLSLGAGDLGVSKVRKSDASRHTEGSLGLLFAGPFPSPSAPLLPLSLVQTRACPCYSDFLVQPSDGQDLI